MTTTPTMTPMPTSTPTPTSMITDMALRGLATDTHATRLHVLLAEVVASWRPIAVYLYGARVESADATGDYDLLVVVDDNAAEADLDVVRTHDGSDDVGAEIVPTTRSCFVRNQDMPYSLEGAVVARGVLVYGGM